MADLLVASWFDQDQVGFALVAAADDAAGVADSAGAVAAYLALPADVLGLADARAPVSGFGVVPADTAAAADLAAAAAVYQAGAADAAGVADASTPTRGISAVPADAATAADSATTQTGTSATVNDVVGIADDGDPTTPATLPFVLDSGGIIIQFGASGALSDTAAVADNVSRVSATGVATADAIGVDDGDSATPATLPFSLDSGGVNLQFGSASVLADAITVADVAGTAGAFSPTLADAIAVADAQARVEAFSAVLTDSVTVADAQALARAIAASLSDAAAVADSALTVSGFGQAVADAVALVDARAAGRGLSFSDVLVVTDDVVASGAAAAGAYTHTIGVLTAVDTNVLSAVVVAYVAAGQVFVVDSTGIVASATTAATVLPATAGANAPDAVATVAGADSALGAV